MPENKAIKHLEHIIWCMGDEPPQNIKNDRDIKEWEDEHKKIKKTYEVAIQSLEEVQAYREIGTVDECAKMQVQYNYLSTKIKKYEAIGTVEDLKTMKENGAFSGVELAQILAMQMELKKYQSIGTIEEFKALKDKATPKKDNNDGGRCKYCGTYNNFIINKLANPKGHPVIHCWNCGQALDWS